MCNNKVNALMYITEITLKVLTKSIRINKIPISLTVNSKQVLHTSWEDVETFQNDVPRYK